MKRAKSKLFTGQIQFDTYIERGSPKMGPWVSHIWRSDPRHLGFLLARYKFCAKMLEGKKEVLEVGCGDAFGTPIVLQTVTSVHGIDYELFLIQDARDRFKKEGIKRCTFEAVDLTKKSINKKFDAAFSLDVIEHIPPKLEKSFMDNLCKCLRPQAVYIMGSPNLASKKHASKFSAASHINLKSADTLKELLLKYFHNAFIFSMNDEVVHTGFYPMAHYLLGMGVGLKKP